MFYKRGKISQAVTNRKLQANFMIIVVENTIKHFYNNMLLKHVSFFL